MNSAALLRTDKLTICINNKVICRKLTFQIKPSERWGILGPNGSGKTTLLHALAGLHPIVQGDIYIREKNLKHLSMKSIARDLGILFQDVNPGFPQTAWEYCLAGRYPHLSYFKKESFRDAEIVRQALQQMELYDDSSRNILHLSGGEKRRLSIAALLAQTPAVYLLDEPTNHLDVKYQIQVLNHFHELCVSSNTSTLMSLHDINLGERYCDYFLLLFPNGETLHGPRKEVINSENLTRLYLHPMQKIDAEGISFWRAV